MVYVYGTEMMKEGVVVGCSIECVCAREGCAEMGCCGYEFVVYVLCVFRRCRVCVRVVATPWKHPAKSSSFPCVSSMSSWVRILLGYGSELYAIVSRQGK